jgi:hypothetical protein
MAGFSGECYDSTTHARLAADAGIPTALDPCTEGVDA